MEQAVSSDIFGVDTFIRSSPGTSSWLLSSNTWHMRLKMRPQVLTPAKLHWLCLSFIYTQEFKTTDQEVNMDPSINFLGCEEINQGSFGYQGDIFTLSYYAEMKLDTDCTA